MDRQKPPLAEIFSPRGVAVIGASPSEAEPTGRGFVKPLLELGFPAIYPVNPKYTEVIGLRCYPNIKDIPGVVDHVVVSIPSESALALLDDCAAKGVKSVHFFTAGFSESGCAERVELEREMLSKARAGGFRIIGPNCVGLYVPKSRVSNSVGLPKEPGPIAFISQSGGHANNLPYYSGPRGLRFSKVVSYGNALDIDECELLEYLSQDPETEIIAAYIEGVKDGRRFLNVLREVTARKPVIIFKGGRTEAGKRAVYGHTASLTSSVAAFDALCKQMRVIQVDDIEELIDVLVALRFINPLPQGVGAAVLGQGGGPSVLASDEMEKAGLQLPNLSAEVESELRQFLPLVGAIFGNPIDATNLLRPESISTAMRTIGKQSNIYMFAYHMGFHPASRWGSGRVSSESFLHPAVDALAEVRRATGKPILMVMDTPPDINGMKEFLVAQEAFVEVGFPVFRSLFRAARAMAKLVAWNHR